MVVDQRAPAAGDDLPLAGEREADRDRVPRRADGADELNDEEDRAEHGQHVGRHGDAPAREGDQDGRRGEADPERPDDERLGIGRVDAPRRRTCREGRPRPAARGRARGFRPAAPRLGGRAGAGSAAPSRIRRIAMTTGRSTANATIATTVSPAWYARTPATSAVTADDQLAVPEHRRAGELPGLGQAREGHADRGAAWRGRRARTRSGSCRAAGPSRRRPGRTRPPPGGPGRGCAGSRRRRGGKPDVGLDREHDEHAEDEDDRESRQAERDERAWRRTRPPRDHRNPMYARAAWCAAVLVP